MWLHYRKPALSEEVEKVTQDFKCSVKWKIINPEKWIGILEVSL